MGALAWLLAVHFQPLVHNLGHRNDHSHGPEPHDHGHHHDSEDDAPPVPISEEHGTASTLHYAAALAVPSVFTLPPPSYAVAGAPDENLRHVAERRFVPAHLSRPAFLSSTGLTSALP